MARRKKMKIKLKAPGSFTAYCKTQGYGGVTSACIAKGKKSKNSKIRKRANFAANARTWKKTGRRKKKK